MLLSNNDAVDAQLRRAVHLISVPATVAIALGVSACAHGAAADQRAVATPSQPAAATTSAQPSVWRRLHRPISLPSSGAGVCPRTRGDRRAPRVGITLGPGPVFPVLGFAAAPPSPRGVVHYRRGLHVRGVGYAAKVLWAGSKGYQGPLLVRAWRLDRPGVMRLQLGERDPIVTELRFAATKTHGWRYWASATLLNAAGCYGYQIDGLTFSTDVVFEVAS